MSPISDPRCTGLEASHSADCTAAAWVRQSKRRVPALKLVQFAPEHWPICQSQSQWTRKLFGYGLFFLLLLIGNFLSQRGSLQQLLLISHCRVIWAREASATWKQAKSARRLSNPLITETDFSCLEEVHIFPNQLLHHRNSQGVWENCLFLQGPLC